MSVRPGRNDPCPCGSGRKFKRCCIDGDDPTPVPPPRFAPLVDALSSPREEPLTTDEGRLAERLRGELSQFPAAISEVILGRVTGLTNAPLDRLIDRAARFLADDRALDAMLGTMRAGPRLVCLLLAMRAFTRGDLVRLLSLRGIDEPGIAISEACQQFPVVWSQGARADLDRLCTLRVVADRVEARSRAPNEVRWTDGAETVETRSAVASLWHALVCAPGALMRARARINLDGTLHAAATAKLERALPHAAQAVAAWAAFGAVLGSDVAELDLDRVRACAQSPAALIRATLLSPRDPCVARLLDILSAAPRGAQVSLGDALVAIATSPRGSTDDIESLVLRLSAGLLDAPWLTVDRARDRLSLPADLHRALAGEPLADGHPRSHVQASYEILLSPSSPFAASVIVGLAAELVHVDAVARLRLTRESVLAARAAGVAADEIVSALRTVSGDRGVPGVVETAVREWTASVSLARVGSQIVLELEPGSPTLDRAADILAPHLVRRPAPHVLLLACAPDRAMIAALAKIGVVLSGVRPVDEPRRAPPGASPESPQIALTRSAFPTRDLRPFLKPEWALSESEAALARAQLRTAPVSPPAPRGVSAAHQTRGSLPPKASLELPKPIANAIAVLRRRWSARADWIAELDRVVLSKSFLDASTTSPDRITGVIERADSPQRLNHSVADLAAAARTGARPARA